MMHSNFVQTVSPTSGDSQKGVRAAIAYNITHKTVETCVKVTDLALKWPFWCLTPLVELLRRSNLVRSVASASGDMLEGV